MWRQPPSAVVPGEARQYYSARTSRATLDGQPRGACGRNTVRLTKDPIGTDSTACGKYSDFVLEKDSVLDFVLKGRGFLAAP
jgi:hypothetical protein